MYTAAVLSTAGLCGVLLTYLAPRAVMVVVLVLLAFVLAALVRGGWSRL
ncbi:hypothetical protein [Nocardioides speluncae]|nr:hypothetical protein [Nocardioides speluncae]